MKIPTVLPFLCALLFCIAASESCSIDPSYKGKSVVRLTFEDDDQKELVLSSLSELCEIKYVQDEHTNPKDNFVELIVTLEQLLKADRMMPRKSVRVLVGDLGAAINHERESYIASPVESGSAGDEVCNSDKCSAGTVTAGQVDLEYYKKYHTYEDFLERWNTLTKTYSDYVSLETIGSTHEGRDIHMFRLGSTSAEKPVRILMNAMQHAREWITPMSVLFTVESLAAQAYKAKAWMYDLEILIVPITNPDGYVHTHTTDRMWRKNRNSRDSCQGEASGVDLNRNWGTDFAGGESTSSDPCSDIFTGPEAFSELETQALKKLFEEIEGIKAHIDVHSFSQLVLGRWSYSDKTPPNVEEVDAVGNLLNDKLSSGGKTYSYARGKTDLIYLASGVMPDWVTDAHGVLSYTYELRPKSMWEGGFMLPAKDIIPTAEEFHVSIEALIEHVLKKH